jgi:hypothetical protein
MHQRIRVRPLLEQLEDRNCPSFTTNFAAGTLTLTGTPLPTAPLSGQELLILRVAGGYEVKDNANANESGGVVLGTFAVTRDLHLNLLSYTKPIVIDLAGGPFPGSIYLRLGLGNIAPPGSPNPITITGGAGAQVNGSVYVSGGSGAEILDIGSPGVAPVPVAVAGSVYFTGNPGPVSSGNSLNISSGSSVGTDVIATQVSNVMVGPATTTPALPAGLVNRNLTVNAVGASSPASLALLGRIAGNLSLLGSNPADSLHLMNSGSVGGSVTASLAGGGNLVTDAGTSVGGDFMASGGAGGVSTNFLGTMGGNLNLNFGNGANNIVLTGSVGKNVNVTMGNGLNNVFLKNGSFIGGNLTLNGGNGTDSITLGGGTSGLIAGNVTVRLGNGSNVFMQSNNFAINGSSVSYYGGSGSNSVTIANPANGYNLYINTGGTMGSATDTVNLSTVTNLGSATIVFGVLPGNKTWNPPAISFPLTLTNFP